MQILHEDHDLVIVLKPAGVLSHPHPRDPGAPDCLDIIQRELGVRVHTVHRLDRRTAGVMVYARSPAAATDLAAQFRRGHVAKTYLALVRGHLHHPAWVERPLIDTASRPARTHLVPLARTILAEPVGPYPTARYTLVMVRLYTGRRHQARRHLHGINHPIVGDPRHGDRTHNRFFRDRFGCSELFLSSISLSFSHPSDGRRLTADAPPPQDWLPILETIGLGLPTAFARPAGFRPATG